MLWPTHRMGGIDGQNLADHQPADGSQVLLDRGLSVRRLQRLYIGSDMNGLDLGQLANVMPLDPGEEGTCGPV